MATYIDADKYFNYLQYALKDEVHDDYNKGYVDGIRIAQKGAKHFFVNLDENKKAYWKWFDEECGNPTDGYDRDWGWECSNCGYVLPDDFDDPDLVPAYKYCMECGAEMIVTLPKGDE